MVAVIAGVFWSGDAEMGISGVINIAPSPVPPTHLLPPNIETNIYAIRNNNNSPVHSGRNEILLLQFIVSVIISTKQAQYGIENNLRGFPIRKKEYIKM